MAAEAEIEEGALASAATKKKGRGRIMLIAGVAAAVIVIGAGSYFFLFANKPKETVESTASAAVAPNTFIFNLPEMTVNLSSPEGSENFMKLTIALEVADEEMMKTIQPRMAKVIDAFQVYLRELRKSDLEGSAGIYRLKEELLRRVNVAIAPAQVENVLFKELLVQ
ncbi:flagellar basal body-associated FliL family protein [Paradevosia shaoguanensis]|uniref:Flagellar protein FliL n=1 Tax=Paradevosia shaoguanensis TaxID=1335043 RepID=A0AA41UDS3_9HYPH|nr:flagellar basal body-associated FliL family protein [Paradevosia shaoguanensis]MCF1743181.1 flagellar basal body-associated FliL family protein [Paradevosia shaoguanensis]MCI0127664.1 flagellar basal body-associated FliL family protein [Paradevosia shaoguanensis]